MSDVEYSHSLRGFLAKATSGTFGLMVVSSALGYLSSVLLARFLGVADFGMYFYLITIVGIAQIPSESGLAMLAQREISYYSAKKEWKYFSGFITWSHLHVLFTSITVSLILFSISFVFNDHNILNISETLETTGLVLLSLPILALSSIMAATLRGMNKILISQVSETLMKPTALIFFVITFYWLTGKSLLLQYAILSFFLSSFLAFLLGFILLFRQIRPDFKIKGSSFRVRTWLRFAFPMMLTKAMFVINNQTDTIMLGAMTNISEIGIYVIAGKMAGFITFILVAVNSSIGPTFAQLHANNDRARLQGVFTKANRVVFISAIVVGGIIILFSSWILLVFGEEYISAKPSLIILCITNIANSFVGSVGLLLSMTGYQDLVAASLLSTGLVNVALNALFIPNFGAVGASTATLISTIIWNLILGYFTYTKLAIIPSPFVKVNS